MNVLFVSLDSLRRDFLGAYRDRPRPLEYDVATPNLDRFAERATAFDTHYAGSLFCMPTRREWLTGVQEFPWRGWGPIEPFDTTLPLAARETGTFTQLITDHYHYFQHGADGYYEDFNAFEFVRGHEFDAWRASPRTPDERLLAQAGAESADGVDFMDRAQYARNVSDFDESDERTFFAPKVFSSAVEFVRETEWDEWFCYVDSFDVHQPFHCPEPYASMYTDEDPRDPALSFWPRWGTVEEGQGDVSERELAFARAQFAGKVTMVDEWVGRLLDALDERDLWEETAVVITSDHGYSLGDHGYIGKIHQPFYDVLARTPLLIHHPEGDGGRVEDLTAAVDLHPTLLELLDATAAGDHPHGRSLLGLVTGDGEYDREWALYGEWGSGACVTDGRYTYMVPCDPSEPAPAHSTTMLNPRGIFLPPEPSPDAEAGPFLPYTDTPVWRLEGEAIQRHESPLLFDTERDPGQTEDIHGTAPETAERMRALLERALGTLDATALADRLEVRARAE
ncbi:MAG: sulfatase-like hydrolase/transferase [Haloarculaceae archaeon]